MKHIDVKHLEQINHLHKEFQLNIHFYFILIMYVILFKLIINRLIVKFVLINENVSFVDSTSFKRKC